MKHRIDTYFQALVENGGSDLHLSEGQPPKIRVHGDITAIEDGILTHEDMVELMEPICPPKLWKIFEEGGDADFAYEMDAQSRFRCNYMKQQRGFCCVFRLIPTKILTMEQLNVPEQIK
ncbi:MAG: type IV pili twitching motility protein PilT, partial [Akkermansia sp.]|nr:type IV pili twitching motility protein PilT [Akkermansia sp.]